MNNELLSFFFFSKDPDLNFNFKFVINFKDSLKAL